MSIYLVVPSQASLGSFWPSPTLAVHFQNPTGLYPTDIPLAEVNLSIAFRFLQQPSVTSTKALLREGRLFLRKTVVRRGVRMESPSRCCKRDSGQIPTIIVEVYERQAGCASLSEKSSRSASIPMQNLHSRSCWIVSKRCLGVVTCIKCIWNATSLFSEESSH